jgi:hypothetical protein
MKYKICIIDGQGGGIGSAVIKKIKEEFMDKVEIIAIGTNSIATAAMLKAKANKGATGENPIKIIANNVDIIIGPISIVLPNSMLGELTSDMATSIASSPVKKIFLPFTQENIEIIGLKSEPLPHMIDKLIVRLREIINV